MFKVIILFYVWTSLTFHYDYEGVTFITFVRNPLYPKGNNASKDEGLWYLTFYVALFLTLSIWEQVPNIGAHLRWTHVHFLSFEHLRQASPSSCRRKKLQRQGLPLCSRWTPIRTSFLLGRPEARRGRPPVQRLRRTTWIKKSKTWRCSISRSNGRRKRWLV